MKTYTLTETRNRYDEVFDEATVEPILVTKQEEPSYVILSAETYQQLIARLEQLEDKNWGQMSETALHQSQMVGVEQFTSALKQLADGEA